MTPGQVLPLHNILIHTIHYTLSPLQDRLPAPRGQGAGQQRHRRLRPPRLRQRRGLGGRGRQNCRGEGLEPRSR